MGCLYRITTPSGAYVGITAKTASERFAVHAYEAARGSRGRLYNAMRKHGTETATVETLVIADDWGYLCDLEKQAIAALGTRSPLGLNMTDGGDGASPGSAHHAGFKHSDEARAKMSAARLGKPRKAETKAKISAALMGNTRSSGRQLTEEHKRQISQANRGKRWTDEQRARMSVAATKREADRRARRVSDGH